MSSSRRAGARAAGRVAAPAAAGGSAPAQPMATLEHEASGRARLRIVTKARDVPFFRRLEDGLRAVTGVRRVEASPLTGSVLVLHVGALDVVLAQAEKAGLFVVRRGTGGEVVLSHEPPHLPAHDGAVAEHAAVDDLVVGDWGTVAGVTLLGLAAFQVYRGKFLPAGLTMVFQGMDFLGGGRRH